MLEDRRRFNRRIVVLGVLIVALIICIVFYDMRSNVFSLAQPPASYYPTLTNSAILQNWLPKSSYQYTISQIDNYLKSNNIHASSMTIKGSVTINEINGGSYDFTLLLEPQNQVYHVSVKISNSSGIISTTVSIGS
jgi:hypothetical protein